MFDGKNNKGRRVKIKLSHRARKAKHKVDDDVGGIERLGEHRKLITAYYLNRRRASRAFSSCLVSLRVLCPLSLSPTGRKIDEKEIQRLPLLRRFVLRANLARVSIEREVALMAQCIVLV